MSTSSQNPEPTSTTRITFEVSKDGWTGGLQLGLSELDENGSGHGYRIHGPKYNGSSKQLLTHDVDQRDADEIRQFLDAKFPPKTDERTQSLREAIEAARAEYLTDATGDETDEAYNRGVSDAIAAIGALIEGGAS